MEETNVNGLWCNIFFHSDPCIVKPLHPVFFLICYLNLKNNYSKRKQFALIYNFIISYNHINGIQKDISKTHRKTQIYCMLLHYVVLSESVLSASQLWVYYTYTDKVTHSPTARERIEVSETKATFRPSASCVWRLPNKWLSSCKPADKANKGREHF